MAVLSTELIPTQGKKAESEFVNVKGAQESILKNMIPPAYIAW
jgi:hypothetical protein